MTTQNGNGSSVAHAPRGPGTSSRSDPLQRRTLIVLVISQVLGTIGLGVAPTIGILLAGEVTDSEAWAGLARTGSTLGAALFGVPLGTLAARRGRRLGLATGWWVAAVGAGLLVVAAQWQMLVPLFLGLLMTGAGTAASLQARFTATDLATPRTRARSLALVMWVGAFGTVIGPNLGVPGAALGAATGLSTFGAAFLIAAVASALAGAVVLVLLRPDPLDVLARRQQDAAGAAPAGLALGTVEPPRRFERLSRVLAEMRVNRAARTALVALLTAQAVMVALMTMTPVHVEHHGGSLTIIGLTISLHVVGMFGLAPVVGILVDRLGPRGVVGIGVAILGASLGLSIFASASLSGVMAALILLGLGWSFLNVAGSALFSAAVAERSRAASQGGADALSNLCGAVAAFASGPLLAATSFSVLGVLSAVVTVPLLILVLRPGAWGTSRTAPR